MTRPTPSGERFWPATFADRGARVPFTTPALAAARLRCREPGSVEFVIPNLAGAKGTYVVPAKAMAETFILTPHDRVLLTELAGSGATSPHDIRTAVLKVANSGLAGPKAAAEAKAVLLATENQEMVGRLFVVVRALKQLSANKETFAAADLMTEAGKKRGRVELVSVSESLGLELDALLDRLEQWGGIVAPLGVVGSAAVGPVRRLYQRLVGLSTEMGAWAAGDWAGDARPDAALVGEVAGETHRVATRLIADVDATLDDIAGHIVPWDETLWRLKARMDEIAWCLDGWDQVVKVWDATDRGSRQRQKEAVIDMVRLLPLLPRSEAKSAHQDMWAGMAMSMRRRVNMLEDWKTGEVDAELAKRLERYRSKDA